MPEIRRDLFVSIVKVLRMAQLQKPELAIAEGQGAAIALLFKSPLVVEASLAARAAQHEEAQQLVAAWNRVGLVVCKEPRLGRRQAGLDVLHEAVQDLTGDYPVAPLKIAVAVPRLSAHRAPVRERRLKRLRPVIDLIDKYDWTTQS